MAFTKMSPRQKMINMMYLVLLALLALNVSKEVLKAFHLMEVSFENTSKSHNQQMIAALNGLETLKKDNPLKADFYYDRAIKAKEISLELNDYLYETQAIVEKIGGGRSKTDELGVGKPELKNGDDLEKHANYFASLENKGKGKGAEVREQLTKTRTAMIALLESNNEDSLHQISKNYYDEVAYSPDLMVNDVVNSEGVTKKWEEMFLIETPLAAAVTNLARLRNENLNLANAVITRLAKAAGASEFEFDNMKALVNPKSNFVMAGTNYEADILLVAANSQSNYKIKIGDDFLPLKEGIGKYMAAAKGVGNHQLEGEIIMPGKDPLPFKTQWTSFMPSATVSPVNMNVLYVGLDNPVQISVPGIDPNNVIVSMEGGTLKKENGTLFVATVNGGKEAKVKVSAKMPDGSIKSMGAMDFRVRYVPKPTAALGALGSGSYSVARIYAQRDVQLYLDDFFFKGVRYQLLSYEMSVLDKHGRIKMNEFDIKTSRITYPRLEPGDKIYVGGFKVKGPGKPSETLVNSIVINVTR